jgi:putative addiction module component (TIGR02574 family)
MVLKYEKGRFMTTETMDLLKRVESLPIDLKIKLVDKILESLSPAQKEIDELWKPEIERRIDALESGNTKSIPANDVLAKIQERFAK